MLSSTLPTVALLRSFAHWCHYSPAWCQATRPAFPVQTSHSPTLHQTLFGIFEFILIAFPAQALQWFLPPSVQGHTGRAELAACSVAYVRFHAF